MKHIKLYKEFIVESTGKANDPIYEAVKMYQNGYTVGTVQDWLRKGKAIVYGMMPNGYNKANYSKYVKGQVDLLDSAMAKVIPKGTILWRGVDFVPTSNFIDEGYTSTSQSLNNTVRIFTGLKGTVMKLIVGNNVKGIDINNYLKSNDIDGIDQEEILLQRGLKYKLLEEGDYKIYQIG